MKIFHHHTLRASTWIRNPFGVLTTCALMLSAGCTQNLSGGLLDVERKTETGQNEYQVGPNETKIDGLDGAKVFIPEGTFAEETVINVGTRAPDQSIPDEKAADTALVSIRGIEKPDGSKRILIEFELSDEQVASGTLTAEQLVLKMRDTNGMVRTLDSVPLKVNRVGEKTSISADIPLQEGSYWIEVAEVAKRSVENDTTDPTEQNKPTEAQSATNSSSVTVLKFLQDDCKNPDLSAVHSTQSFHLCDGTEATGTFTPVDTTNLLAQNVRAGVTINGTLGTLTPSPDLCTKDGEQGCVTSSDFPSVLAAGLSAKLLTGQQAGGTFGSYTPLDTTNLVASNIKKDVVIGGVTGSYELDTTPPAAVTGLNLTANDHTSVQVDFNAAAGASTYVIYRDGAELTTTAATSYTDSTAVVGSTHHYSVVARSASGTIAAPVTASISVPFEEFLVHLRPSDDCTGYSPCYSNLYDLINAGGGISYGACASKDLVCAQKKLVIRVGGDWSGGPVGYGLIFENWNTSSQASIRIFTAPEARHNGTDDITGGAFKIRGIDGGAGTHRRAAAIRVSHVTVEGMILETLENHPAVSVGGNNVVFDGVLVTDANHDEGHGFVISGDNSSVVIRNSIITNTESGAIVVRPADKKSGYMFNTKVYIENVTVYNACTNAGQCGTIPAIGFVNHGSFYYFNCTIHVKNSYVHASNSAAAFGLGANSGYEGSWGESSHNMSYDGTAVGTSSINNVTVTDVATDPGAGDWFAVQDLSSSPIDLRTRTIGYNDAIGAGLDLSSQFSTDIHGDDRGATWTIGADQ